MSDRQNHYTRDKERGQHEAVPRAADAEYEEMIRVDRELDRLFNEFWVGAGSGRVQSGPKNRKKG